MKRLLVLMLAAAGLSILIAGCTSAPKSKPAPASDLRPTVQTSGDLQLTDEIYATITENQLFEMNGKEYKVSEIPSVLKKKNVKEYITVLVDQDSKMTRETLASLVKTLVDNGFFVAIDENSKFADLPVPKKS